MKKRIHINQHVIRANKKNGTNDPAITVKTSKQNIIITLTCRDHDTHFEFAVRTNEVGIKHKLGQFIRLAFKYNGVVDKK